MVYATVHNVQIVDIGGFFVVFYVENINIVQSVAYNLALASVVLQKDVFALYCLCLFKPHLFCEGLHLCEHLAFDFTGVSFQDFTCLVYVRKVFISALKTAARTFTVLYMVLQT